MFLVVKSFTDGLLAGSVTTVLTSVEYVVGKHYEPCAGSSSYRVLRQSRLTKVQADIVEAIGIMDFDDIRAVEKKLRNEHFYTNLQDLTQATLQVGARHVAFKIGLLK